MKNNKNTWLCIRQTGYGYILIILREDYHEIHKTCKNTRDYRE